jgi:hypothetical protein
LDFFTTAAGQGRFSQRDTYLGRIALQTKSYAILDGSTTLMAAMIH